MIKIEHLLPHTTKIGYVDWRLGNTCNYKCSYCPPYENSGSHPWIDIDTNIKTQNIIVEGYAALGKTTSFAYTGGEPTVYKDFPKLLANGKQLGSWNWVYTNGSRSVRYWNDIKDVLDMACISYHAEYDQDDHLIAVVDAIKNQVYISINVVMHPLQLDKCIAFIDKFKSVHPEIVVDTKIVRVNHQEITHPDYTPGSIAKILEYKKIAAVRNKKQSTGTPFLGKNVVMKLTEPDHPTRQINCQEEILLGSHGYNDFNGWECYIGVESLMIDFDGQVYKGYCKMDGSIGKIPNFSMPQLPTTCQFEGKRCTCNLDFATTKYSTPNKTFYFKQH